VDAPREQRDPSDPKRTRTSVPADAARPEDAETLAPGRTRPAAGDARTAPARGVDPGDAETVIGPPTRRAAGDMATQPSRHDADAPPPALSDLRYGGLEKIGAGGMGVVYGGEDRHLGRSVAVKVMRLELGDHAPERSRFLREARATAQLEHPGIVPVHELGRTEDGRVYFTMKHVRGDTLEDVLVRLKAADAATAERYTLVRLLGVFSQICQAVAFAHSRGVIHRDLKPDNVLLGRFGEVLVMDWGLVKVIGRPGEGDGADAAKVDVAPLGDDLADNTIDGSISGTPRYMSPEQAQGHTAKVGVRSDVYSLGAVLYEILTLEPPFQGRSLSQVLDNVVRGAFVPPRRRAPRRRIPRELDAICRKAMATDPADRYADATALLADVEHYLEGRPVSARPDRPLVRAWKWCKRHPVVSSTITAAVVAALAVVVATRAISLVRYHLYVALADGYRMEGHVAFEKERQILDKLEALRAKNRFKHKSPREVELETEAARWLAKRKSGYEAAVILYVQAYQEREISPRCDAAMKEIYGNRIRQALRTRDLPRARALFRFLREAVGQDYEQIDEATRRELVELEAQLDSAGSLAVTSRPAGAAVTLWPLEVSPDGVLRRGEPQDLGATPVGRVRQPMGSYLLELRAPARPAVLRPVQIDHGEELSVGVDLPARIPEGTVYVPAGRAYLAGAAARYLKRYRAPVSGFFIKKHEVTFGEYLAFWRSLAAPAARRAAMSRIRLDRAERRFLDGWDAGGRLQAALRPEFPVVGITREAAEAYCRWLGKRLGRACRLPTAVEWEKAARGVDGRRFVWGNAYDATHAYVAENAEALARFGGRWAPPGSFPRDASVYGVLDMAGNVREWTGSRFPTPDAGRPSPFYQIKGASLATSKRFLPCAYSSDTPVVPSDVGFRYVLPLAPEEPATP
jgi:serine/threonine-protein kinase